MQLYSVDQLRAKQSANLSWDCFNLSPAYHTQAAWTAQHDPLPTVPDSCVFEKASQASPGHAPSLAQKQAALYLETLPNLPLPVVPCIVDQQYTQLSVNPAK